MDNSVPIEAVACIGTRYPPYGREVAEAVSSGRAPNVYVFLGPGGWERARQRLASHGPGSVMVLPVGEDPTMYRWPRVTGGLLLDARNVDRQTAIRVATVIVSAGTPLAWIVRDNEGFAVQSRSWGNPLQVAA